jgi:hypothetical protein
MATKMTKEIQNMPRLKGLEGLKREKFPHGGRRMPKEVDIVTAKDIYCGGLSGNGNHMRHCLLGLSQINFGDGERGVDLADADFAWTDEESYVNKELSKSVKAFTGRTDVGIVSFNDRFMGEEQRHWIAKLWNATMARIGYTEGNPQAK